MSDQSPRLNAAMRRIVTMILQTARRTIDEAIARHEREINPHPQYRLTVRTEDSTTTGQPTIIVVPDGTLTYPAPGTAQLSGGGGGSSDLGFDFKRNGSQRFVARSAVTFGNPGQAGGGTVTYTKNGTPTTLPVALLPDDVLEVILSGATTPVNTAVTLQAVA